MLWLLLVLAGAVLVAAAALALTLPGLRSDLTHARTQLTSVQAATGRGDIEAARTQLRQVRSSSASAVSTVHGLRWRLARHLPVLGPSLQEATAVAEAVDATAAKVLPPLVATDFRPNSWNGRIDPTPLLRAQAPLHTADTALRAVRVDLARAPSSRVRPVGDARNLLADRLQDLAATLRELSVAADVVPGLVGTTKPQRYFVAVQNNAEARATGGLVGAYGVLRLDKGRFALERVGPNQELKDRPGPVLSLGDEFDRRYGQFKATSTWRSANLTPDTPTAGRLLTEMWRDQTGQQLDGTIFLDPTALGMLLSATGPVTLGDGTRLTAANAVQVLLADVYRRFTRAEDAARNAYLQDTARLAFKALSRSGLSGRKVAAALGDAAASGHLQLWSADAA